MTARSLAVMDRRCTGECAASSLLIGALHVWRWVSVKVWMRVWMFFFYMKTMTVLTHVAEFDIFYQKVFGAGQLDVAAKAVSARFDTLWYLKGKS